MKLLAFAILVLFAATPSFANNYKSAGCGLGSMIIKDDGFVQIFAATTNGSFGTQTFGITSGTSNCSGAGGFASREAEEKMFVTANHDAIVQETAQGSGEHLNALASMMGCGKSSDAAFAAKMKKNYKNITSTQTSDEMLNEVKTMISADSGLSKACNS